MTRKLLPRAEPSERLAAFGGKASSQLGMIPTRWHGTATVRRPMSADFPHQNFLG